MTFSPKRIALPRLIFDAASAIAGQVEAHPRIPENQKDRWYNALMKATGQLMDGVRFEHSSEETVFPSRTRSGLSHRVNGYCTCEAAENGAVCWHRAARAMIILVEDVERVTLIEPPQAPPACPRCNTDLFVHEQRLICPACQYSKSLHSVSREQAMQDMNELYS